VEDGQMMYKSEKKNNADPLELNHNVHGNDSKIIHQKIRHGDKSKRKVGLTELEWSKNLHK
jgi:hypothetical protein